MTYLMSLFLIGLIVGMVAVASNPAPYFAALGLVVSAGVGCGILAGHGGSFLSLILFLIYLGGMLVVFAYSAALAAEPYPEAWGGWSVIVYMLVYMTGVVVAGACMWGGWYEGFWVMESFKEFMVVRGDTSGAAFMYSFGGGMLVISAWVLLLTLFVVLELTRGLSRGTLRAV
uniref:NADH-ubiquinone oxidoreductase chain 6 n=1 Tax=Denticeps clupeoides TaxID=299321 RepID=Q2A0I4_9TELE|nr:NADH dehydrogenase subunit 6 [Denticeps clupeoides]BAE79953.1 NADH dehydrogenase subunit 6 [Denticeps clupeoides]